MEPISNLNFEFWSDDENNGRRYAEEFLDSLGDVRAEKVAHVLDEQFAALSFIELLRERKIADVPNRPGLYYLRIDIKDLRVRLFGKIVAATMWLVHGAVKQRFRELSQDHFETAESRIKRIDDQIN